MEFYKELQLLSEEEIEVKVRERIKSLEQDSIADKKGEIIGFLVGQNPESYLVSQSSFEIDMRCFYSGYVNKNSKIVYGISYNNDGTITNNGSYYYLDTEDYLVDFCKFISQESVSDIYDLFDYILEFLREYFGYYKKQERDIMFQMLKDEKGYPLKTSKEHGISWFKGKGNAMCSEYATIAQNILSLFGIDSYLIIGYEQTNVKDDGEFHAFNLISFQDEDQEEINALIDFANFVKVLDVKFNKIGEAPFIAYLDRLDEEFVRELVFHDRHLLFEDYDYYILGDTMVQIGYNRKRDYFVNSEIIPEKTCKKMK